MLPLAVLATSSSLTFIGVSKGRGLLWGFGPAGVTFGCVFGLVVVFLSEPPCRCLCLPDAGYGFQSWGSQAVHVVTSCLTQVEVCNVASQCS